MVGTKHKTPPRPKNKRKKGSRNFPIADDHFRAFGRHNERHGKMGARERGIYAQLKAQGA